MARFLLKASYTPEGISGLRRDGGTKRAEVVQAMIENAGGRVEALYFAFEEHDAYVLCELPDNMTAASLTIAIRAGRGLDVRITPLMTPEEVDAVTQLPVFYEPPGR
ncbi:GYD domain-containing protein [Micromonospora sp. PLK6-60]|uniref:GYD domain-containing protein n=1 Tax=Micromonospora sp. PLK6-60 TaxID=2873383 RepID=UPI0027DF4926|nr:GYD domain-containing protein [Micromonospora sp. PLK6-60]